jgi:hypothetical protein
MKKFLRKLIGKTVIGQIVRAVGVGLLAMIGAGWGWIWMHFNPSFDYSAPTSSLASHFVSLGDVLNKIDKDSRVYCTGGLEERLARIGLRSCHRFFFTPPGLYRMTICTHDERTAEYHSPNQFKAITYFEKTYSPLECFRVVQRAATDDYDIVQGKDPQFRKLQFAADPPRDEGFCGCSDDEVKEIARTIGAVLH